MASHRADSVRKELEGLLSSARELSADIAKVLDHTSSYDLVRQLKKIDAELLDVQHNLTIAIEMQESGHNAT